MAILRPDAIKVVNGVPVNEYLLTNHNPRKIEMPTISMPSDKVIGVTIHNTNRFTTSAGMTPAELCTKLTVNGHMRDVRVHYYCDDVCAWQNLPLTLSGWHAADGEGDGNCRTVSIECIMGTYYDERDIKAEDNCARLAAAVLNKFGLGIDAVFTHTHWLNIRDGKKGTVDELNVMHHDYKMCPSYIIPHWAEFKARVESYLNS